MEKLFARFDKHLTDAGYLAMGGQIVDATIVAAPKQRNSKEEKEDINAGKVLQHWKDKPAKLRQKDRDARWTVKFSKAKVDEEGKVEQRDIAVPAFNANLSTTAIRMSAALLHTVSWFVTRIQNLAPSVCSIQMP